MSTDFSKLIALETALEHLIKAQSGEKLEYLAPNEKAPGDTKIHTTQRGAKGYYPSEVGTAEIDQALGTTDGIREEVRRLAELPEEEREIDVVTPEDPQERSLEERRGDAWSSREKVNAQFENMYADLREAIGEHEQFLGSSIDPSQITSENLTKAGFTDGSDEGSASETGLGITSYANFTVEVAGKKFIFKASHDRGDNRSEMLAYSADRALGLNLVPYVQPHSIDTNQLVKAFIDTHTSSSERPDEFYMDQISRDSLGVQAAGHFQEFCENCLSRAESQSAIAEMLASKEGREEFLKLILLDSITGNPDRHSGNYLITEDHKILAIDNGFAGYVEHAQPHDSTANIELHEINRGVDLDFPYGMGQHLANSITWDEKEQILSGLEQEATDVFDKYFNEEALSDALAAVNWAVKNLDVDKFKDLFTSQVNRLLVPVISGESSRGQGDDTPFWDSLPELVFPPTEPGEHDRHRDWKATRRFDRMAPDDKEIGWGDGDTPAHLQGGPRQGARR